jgi:hypothetical protein
MTFETFKQQLKPEDFMLDNLMATMKKCFEAGQEDAAASYKDAILKAAKEHPELNVKPGIFLCHVYAKRSKD